MMELSIVVGIINCILILFTTWIVRWFGSGVRYFYLTIGSFLGVFSNGSLWYWTILVLSLFIAFWLFKKVEELAREGKAIRYQAESVKTCNSAYFTGLIIGLIISFVKYLGS